MQIFEELQILCCTFKKMLRKLLAVCESITVMKCPFVVALFKLFIFILTSSLLPQLHELPLLFIIQLSD